MNTIAQLNAPAHPENPATAAIRKKAVELEGVFLNTLMSQMFSSLNARNGFGGGQAEETWRSMQSEYYANEMAASGGIGLADDIMRNLINQQAALSPAAPAQSTTGDLSR